MPLSSQRHSEPDERAQGLATPLSAQLIDFPGLAARSILLGDALVLEGVDMGPAGLNQETINDLTASSQPSRSMSFCLNGVTYTAIEDPDDGYRSGLEALIERPGNHCKNAFPGVPVSAIFHLQADDISANLEAARIADESLSCDIMTLVVSTFSCESLDALSVGTDRDDGYYPSFVNYFSAEALSLALSAHETRVLDSAISAASDQTSSGARRV